MAPLGGQTTGANLEPEFARAAAAFTRNDCEAASKAYETAARLAGEAGNPAAVALAKRRIGICRYRVGDHAGALAVYREGMTASAAAHDPEMLVENTHGAALALRHLGLLEEAVAVGRQEYALAQQCGHPDHLLHSMTLLADIYSVTGRGQDAVELWEKGLEVTRKAGDRVGEAGILNSLALYYADFGDPETAMNLMRQMIEHADPAKPLSLAQSYGNQGALYRVLGKPDLSRQSYLKALSLAEGPQGWRIRSATLFNLSILERSIGQNAASKSILEQCLAIAGELKDEEYESRVHTGLSEISRALGDLPSSEESARKGLALGRKVGSPGRVFEALMELGTTLEKGGKPEAAQAAYLEAMEIFEGARASEAGDPTVLRNLLRGALPLYQTLVRLAIRRGDTLEALTWVERSKARVLTEVLLSGGARERGVITADERAEENRLRQAVVAANRKSVAADTADARRQLRAAISALDAFGLRLHVLHPELAIQRADFAPATRQQLAALIPRAGAAMIEYFFLQDTLAAFVLRRSPKTQQMEITAVELPVTREALATAIKTFRAALARRDLAYAGQARQLYQRVVQPLDTKTGAVTSLTIVPDGALWELPFTTLMDAQGRHIAETRTVALAPSFTALGLMRARRSPAQSASLRFLGIASSTPGAAALPEADREIQEIGKFYTARAAVFTGPGARDGIFRQKGPDAAVIHIAAHAKLQNSAPLYSSLALGPPGSTVLARDILEMRLRARLVVLSACETGRGSDSPGEGLIGMGWALTAAGASASILSQWKVDSGSTETLMVALHRNLAAGRSISESLRLAVLETRKQPGYQHPFYWAAFTLLGDGS